MNKLFEPESVIILSYLDNLVIFSRLLFALLGSVGAIALVIGLASIEGTTKREVVSAANYVAARKTLSAIFVPLLLALAIALLPTAEEARAQLEKQTCTPMEVKQ